MKSLLSRGYWALMTLLCSTSSYANFSLGGGGDSGIFAPVAAFFQSVTDFIGGTGAMFVIFLSACGAITMWVLMPKNAGAAIAWMFRAIIGGICFFGMGMLVTWIKGF
ncbi:hypothetical protein [Vibrio scophthalmi]|uniref:Conjugal transfer protein TrbC n=1 Tax=Vibrio scophthalmi LMG 19158 TaxID=870967 RepID=F9RNA5_9VIBR|nr:hypothetical protein [Vibrio scophthalmi]EGU37250.1 hypothetical protein VIS19158_03547 [Vibrio scophthalmi LMG 19158]